MTATELSVENVSWAPRKRDPLLLHPTSITVPAGAEHIHSLPAALRK